MLTKVWIILLSFNLGTFYWHRPVAWKAATWLS